MTEDVSQSQNGEGDRTFLHLQEPSELTENNHRASTKLFMHGYGTTDSEQRSTSYSSTVPLTQSNTKANYGNSQFDLLVQRKWFIQAREGDIRDHYEFEERIGAGTFGAVYRAKDR